MREIKLGTFVNSLAMLPGTLALLLLWQVESGFAKDEFKLGNVLGSPGSTALLPITFTGGTNIVAAQFDVIYLTNYLDAEAVVTDMNLAGFTTDSNELTPGTRRIIIYSMMNKPVPNGSLLHLPFLISSQALPLAVNVTLTNAVFANAQGESVDSVALTAGTIAILSSEASRFTSVDYSTNGIVQLQFTGIDGKNYIFQSSSDLQTWTSFSTNSSGGGPVSVSDTNTIAHPYIFYRALETP